MEPMSEAQTSVITAPVPEGKVYTIGAIRGSTILFGPLAGAYMISNNFKVFGDKKKADRTWIFAMALLLVLCVVGVFFQKMAQSIGFLPIVIGVAAAALAESLQGADIKGHITNGGAKYGFLNILGVCIVALVVTVIVMASFVLSYQRFIPES